MKIGAQCTGRSITVDIMLTEATIIIFGVVGITLQRKLLSTVQNQLLSI